MPDANGRYQPLCRDLVVDVMTADELAQFANGWNAAVTLCGFSSGAQDEIADGVAQSLSGDPMPVTDNLEWLRSYVAEKVKRLRDQCANDLRIDERKKGAM